MDKCEGCMAVEADLVEFNNRVQRLEHSTDRMKEAFPKNDLGLPNYDGHRTSHVKSEEQEKVVEGYKRDATKTVLGWILAFVGGLFSLGFVDWIKTHLR